MNTKRTARTVAAMMAVAIWAVLVFCSCGPDRSATGPLALVPEDIPLYYRAKYVDLKSSQFGMQIIMNTTADPDRVLTWYEKKLPRNGWNVKGRVKGPPDMVMARKDGKNLTVSVLDPGEDQRQIVTINYSFRF